MKTTYSYIIIAGKPEKYWYGDKLLRIVSAILHVVELGFIIYLLVR